MTMHLGDYHVVLLCEKLVEMAVRSAAIINCRCIPLKAKLPSLNKVQYALQGQLET